MKRLFLTLVMSLIVLAIHAQDFKFDNGKFRVLAPGQAELVEMKKASGNYVIPAKVTDMKTKSEYNVISIGPDAFRKSNIESVTIPECIEQIGMGEFMAHGQKVKIPAAKKKQASQSSKDKSSASSKSSSHTTAKATYKSGCKSKATARSGRSSSGGSTWGSVLKQAGKNYLKRKINKSKTVRRAKAILNLFR